MKILTSIAFGAVALASSATAIPASAAIQRTVVHQRTVVRTGPAGHRRTVCTTRWYHHRRVRSCHTVYR